MKPSKESYRLSADDWRNLEIYIFNIFKKSTGLQLEKNVLLGICSSSSSEDNNLHVFNILCEIKKTVQHYCLSKNNTWRINGGISNCFA